MSALHGRRAGDLLDVVLERLGDKAVYVAPAEEDDEAWRGGVSGDDESEAPRVAIVGVPNRFDPFLRPVYVRMMQWVGLYGYGAERSFTPGQLRRMARRTGFRVVGLSGVLFLPGWLRMLELLAHSRGWRRTATFLGRCSAPFRAAYLRWPSVRRHGYLLALGVERPAETS